MNKLFPSELTTDDYVLELSWNIATEPRLYRELSLNPYAAKALQIISKRFPETSIENVIKAVVLAEPEGDYDRNFRLLSVVQQAEAIERQKDATTKMNERLVQFCTTYATEFRLLPKDFVYNGLSLIVFETADEKEIKQRYCQNQRRDFRLAIVTFIEDLSQRNFEPLQKNNKKFQLRQPILLAVFATLFLVPIFSLAIGLYGKYIVKAQSITQNPNVSRKVLGITTQKENRGVPKRLIIPSITVDAPIEDVGVTPEGTMNVPDNTADVGWFGLGVHPGEKGSAVIAGHFDKEDGSAGVFAHLDTLKPGDKIYIEDSRGITTSFVVRESRLYDPGYANDVFNQSDAAHLNLITCDGVWDEKQKSYTKRLVVFADIIR